MVNTATELTFTLSAHTNYKVKTLTINGITYSAVTDNTITQKVKIEKNTAVSAMLEAESNPTPDAGTFTDTQGNNVTIEPVKAYGGEITGYRLTGDIYIEELNSEAFKAKLNTLNGQELYTYSLNINCFKSNPAQTGAGTYISKEITPELLKGVLELKKARKFSTLKLNNETPNGTINILFESTVEKPFDITDLTKFSFSDNFKLENNSNIILGSTATKETDAGDYDITAYPKVHELLKLLNNEKFKGYITVKDVYITGNVKDLLPLLVEPGRIKEVNGGIKFLNVKEFTCPGPNVTEYDGGTNNKTPLPVEQLIEFHKRTNEMYDAVIKENARSVRWFNLVLENVNTTAMNEEQLKFVHFKEDFFSGNILFKDSNLSKIDMKGVQGGTADVIFENTILPVFMLKSKIKNLTLKNATLPTELKTASLKSMVNRIPEITGILKIYNLQGRFFDKWTEEEMKKSSPYKYAPEKYVGPEDIWKKLKLLYRNITEFNKQTKTHFTNEDLTDVDNDNINFSALQKPQDTFLALLGNSTAHG